jgi:hypothetical protein
MPKSKDEHEGPCLYEISGQSKKQYIVAYENQVGGLLHHPELDMSIFRGKVTIKNMGRVLMNAVTLERLAAEQK